MNMLRISRLLMKAGDRGQSQRTFRTCIPILTSQINQQSQANVIQAADDLKITDTCAKRLKEVSEGGEFLRISVEGGGCSGFSYKFQLDTNKEDGDKSFSRDGVEVVTDPESFDLIKGSTIDYAKELIKSAFFISNNPQANSGCSCGVSFSIDI